jgi:hypothetical protein
METPHETHFFICELSCEWERQKLIAGQKLPAGNQQTYGLENRRKQPNLW